MVIFWNILKAEPIEFADELDHKYKRMESRNFKGVFFFFFFFWSEHWERWNFY